MATSPGVGNGSNPKMWVKFQSAVKDRDMVHQESVLAQHELMLNELEATDGSLSTTLRTVYDGNQPDKFLERLDGRIKGHDREIERMCNYHYQGFAESIRELLTVRADGEKLKEELVSSSEQLQQSSGRLMERGQELVRCRATQKNIASTIQHLTLCLPVLEMYGKLREQMASKRYYPALKTLEQLEYTYLPRIATYKFAQTLNETIPRMREQVQNESLTELKDFLENIRKHSARIGQVAMKHADEHSDLARGRVNSRELGDEDEEEEARSAQDLVDFSPVYRCLHIYSVLGAREKFESFYRRERSKQARLAVQPPPKMVTVEAYRSYFFGVVGFFVVEDHILSTTSGLVNTSYVDELWEKSLQRICAVLRTHTTYCGEPGDLLELKKMIVRFCLTLQGYGYRVSPIMDGITEVREQYHDLLMRQWVEVFDSIFQEDNYTPITAVTPEEYQDVLHKYPHHDDALHSSPFPRVFPFSQFVPNVFLQVKNYIHSCLRFSDDLHLSHTEIDEVIRKSTNVLLTRTLGGCLSSLIRRPNLTLVQLVQISINMNHLEHSTQHLQEFIANITGAEKDSEHVAKLRGSAMFKDAQNAAEEQIYEKLKMKIDDFLELAEYDWVSAEVGQEASSFVHDLVSFLHSTFASFTHLPATVAQTGCMSACQHIASRLMESLLDPDVRALSLPALAQLNLDVSQCEEFARSNPVAGMRDGNLLLAFADLRQLLDLLTRWDWATYFAEHGQRGGQYHRVKPATVIALLEKVQAGEKRRGNFLSALKKGERDKKKLLETVLKQLRSLLTTPT